MERSIKGEELFSLPPLSTKTKKNPTIPNSKYKSIIQTIPNGKSPK
jgi:hypothetical protein